jgi:hypothetical protein
MCCGPPDRGLEAVQVSALLVKVQGSAQHKDNVSHFIPREGLTINKNLGIRSVQCSGITVGMGEGGNQISATFD